MPAHRRERTTLASSKNRSSRPIAAIPHIGARNRRTLSTHRAVCSLSLLTHAASSGRLGEQAMGGRVSAMSNLIPLAVIAGAGVVGVALLKAKLASGGGQ